MTEQPRTWRIEHRSLRADAPGIFVPLAEIDGAEVGDLVIVAAGDSDEERTAEVAELTVGSGEPYARVRFVEPPDPDARASP